MTKFLIAGGAGYVGTALVTELLAAGHCATVFDRFSLGEASFAPVADDPRLRLAPDGSHPYARVRSPKNSR